MDRPPLDAARLRGLLGDRWPSVGVVDATTSTNADLLAVVDAGAPARSLLAAEVQSAGRGRFDRVWTSPRGAGLTFSVLLRPSSAPPSWGWLPLLAGVAVARAVRARTSVPAVLKWPNDVLAADGRKLAGILVQSSAGAVVVGIGLNVSTTAAELPVSTATSLAEAGGLDLDRTALLAAICSALDEQVTGWDAGADPAGPYRALCATLGQQVRVGLNDGGSLTGTAVDIDAGGALVIDTGQDRRTVVAGDVEHVRAAPGPEGGGRVSAATTG